jgi:small-conductance mechanosensitive channel
MKALRTLLLLTLVTVPLVATTSLAQDTEVDEAATPAIPFPALQQDWWDTFEGTPEEVGPRIEAFLEQVSTQVADLGAQNQETALVIIGAVRDNLELYQSLLDDLTIQVRTPPPLSAMYSVDEMLVVAATARDARASADAAQVEVAREQRIFDGASRRRDAVFKDYVDAAEGDERWLAALRLVRARSALAISGRRLELLTENARQAAADADLLAERVELAQQRLANDVTLEDLATLVDEVNARADAIVAAEERQRAAQIGASGLDVDTAAGRFEQRLQQQRALDADVELAQARIAHAQAESRRFWTELKLDTEPDLSLIEDQVLAWSELIRDVVSEVPDWRRQTEDELLSAQSVNRDDLDREAQRILDQRVGTARETLAHLGSLNASLADLDLLMTAVDNAIADYSSRFRLWIYNAGRSLKTAWIRITEFTELTLFSAGETPVTVGDIVQAVVILLVGWLLSRGIRATIRRVGPRESLGTQASLYAISRLTHYTIVIVAVLIALSSIGLDFSNLAIVAGALSVGIGFGLQSIVNNFVSGIIILFEHSLRVGDYIELDTGLTGTVKAINVRSTLINTNDNIDIVVPNSEIISTKLTNWTLGEHILRVRIPFGVAYGTDKELVRKAAIEACDEVPYTLTHMSGREPDVWLVEYGDNSLNFLLLVWVNRQGARRPTRTRAAYLWAMETKFREYGIQIPFPQRDLHLRSGWPPGEAPTSIGKP